MESSFYQNYLKCIRNKFYIGQSEIAEALYCSVSTYSKMEQGKKEIQFKDFETAIHFYEQKKEGYSFCFDKQKKEEAHTLIEKCITAFVYRTQKDMLDELKIYLNDPTNLHSHAFFETKLLEMLYEYFADLPFQERLPFLLEHMELFDPMDQSIIYDLQGLSQLRAYNEKAEISFQAAKTTCILLNIPGWTGLIDHHLILTYLRFMKPEKAFPLLEDCGREFQNAGAHHRLLNLKFNQAHCFMKLGLHQEANRIFINLIQTYHQVANEQFLKLVYENYSWNQFLQKNYAVAVDLCQKALALDSLFPDLYITLSYSFYQLGEKEKALAFIEEFRSQNRNDERSKMVLKFLDVLESNLLGHVKTFERLAWKLLPKLSQWKDLEVDLLVYQMLIDHYKTLDDEHQLCIVQEQMIRFLMS